MNRNFLFDPGIIKMDSNMLKAFEEFTSQNRLTEKENAGRIYEVSKN